jgi:hypothetical protein
MPVLIVVIGLVLLLLLITVAKINCTGRYCGCPDT